MLYQVVTGRYLVDLTGNVQKQISFGWEPIGGVGMSNDIYTQAMIKRK